MGRRIAAVLFWGGVLTTCLVPALAGWLTASFGEDLIQIEPWDESLIEINRFGWEEGESVVGIYGNAAREETIRFMWPDDSRILVPEEDSTLRLYKVKKGEQENPLQARTLWFVAEKTLIFSVLAILAGAGLFAIRRS